MASTTELRINLAALKRQDPYIGKITDSSTHVAVYSFSPQSSEWEKTDVEGALFVYRRVAPPYWGFTILNRLSMENLTEPLTSELEFQTQNPFLLYRNAKLLIYGIWFYDQDDCQRIGELLEKLCCDSTTPVSSGTNQHKINIFDSIGINNVGIKEPAPKSASPTSNSVNSISPGSSVGGVQRPHSNGEADSESEDKEVAQNSKGSIDIMDLLCKAQNKYEKEKRNTPDPTVDLQNGIIVSPSEIEMPIMKPVPVKPTHPKKLDIAALFKQQPQSDTTAVATNSQTNNVSMLPTTTMTAPHFPGITQQIVNLPQPSVNVNIPQPQRRPPVGRSFSMTDIQMRQQLDVYMNGNVMSVEEVEANMNRTTAVNRQQQVNSTLDRMIDRINSGGGLSTPGAALSQLKQLPGIQETSSTHNFVQTNALTGNSGSMVVNGNKQTFFSDSDAFSGENVTTHPFAGVGHVPAQTFVRLPLQPGQRQRSISTSGVQPSRLGHIGINSLPSVPSNQQFPANFPLVLNPSTAPNQIIASVQSLPVTHKINANFPKVIAMQNESGLLLHGNAVATNRSPVFSDPLVTAITTAVSTAVTMNDQHQKVPLTTTIMPSASKSCPAIPTTLISPEDFERSATTPQKKMELKQRLLQQNPQQPQQVVSAVQTPLTKENLQQTLVSLLQNDGSFLAVIHEAYLANFNNQA